MISIVNIDIYSLSCTERWDYQHLYFPVHFYFRFQLVFHNILLLKIIFTKVIAIYLGTTNDKMNLNDNGWGIVLGWSIWFIILFLILESLKYLDEDNQGNFKIISYWN